MKKILSILLALSLLVGCAAAFAEGDLGVKIIGGQQTEAIDDDELSLDDLQLGKVYRISGNAIVAPMSFQFADCFAQYTKDSTYTYETQYEERDKARVYTYAYGQDKLQSRFWNAISLTVKSAVWMDAGLGNQFAWFRVDITNVNDSVKDLSKLIAVKVVYADEYEFGGWIRLIDTSKIDFKYSDGNVSRRGFELTQHPSQIATHPENVGTVGYMQTGFYALGCTLPKYVVEDTTASLRMEIEINGETMTYIIRK